MMMFVAESQVPASGEVSFLDDDRGKTKQAARKCWGQPAEFHSN